VQVDVRRCAPLEVHKGDEVELGGAEQVQLPLPLPGERHDHLGGVVAVGDGAIEVAAGAQRQEILACPPLEVLDRGAAVGVVQGGGCGCCAGGRLWVEPLGGGCEAALGQLGPSSHPPARRVQWILGWVGSHLGWGKEPSRPSPIKSERSRPSPCSQLPPPLLHLSPSVGSRHFPAYFPVV